MDSWVTFGVIFISNHQKKNIFKNLKKQVTGHFVLFSGPLPQNGFPSFKVKVLVLPIANQVFQDVAPLSTLTPFIPWLLHLLDLIILLQWLHPLAVSWTNQGLLPHEELAVPMCGTSVLQNLLAFYIIPISPRIFLFQFIFSILLITWHTTWVFFFFPLLPCVVSTHRSNGYKF